MIPYMSEIIAALSGGFLVTVTNYLISRRQVKIQEDSSMVDRQINVAKLLMEHTRELKEEFDKRINELKEQIRHLEDENRRLRFEIAELREELRRYEDLVCGLKHGQG